MEYDEEPPAALGTVVENDRGSLPFALIHGEALVACASWALGEAGVTPVDLGTEWAGITAADEPFVLHDSLCPMTPGRFIADCVAACLETDTVVVGVRPVTDTVKQIEGGLVAGTVDRDDLAAVTSPIVIPARVVRALTELPSWDFAELVVALGADHTLTLLEAPAQGRRVSTLDDVEVLEALTDQSENS